MKIPIIRKGEYDIWSMRMRQYICHTDHNLWDVIVNGDLEEESAPTSGETYAPPAPKTAKQLAAKRNQERVKSILLLAIPDEYLLKFHNVPDAKSLWEAIKSSLDKAYDRFQKLISQLEVHGAPISKEDINQKFLRSLPSSWNQIAFIMRNKPGIDEIDIDDLYNNLMKRSSSFTSNSQNLAFLSSENTNSTNEVSTANGDIGVSTAGGTSQVPSNPCTHDVACSFFAQPTTSSQLENEDFQQIDEDELEELDLRWHFARECRSGRNQERRSYGDNGRSNAPTNESSSHALVAQDGLGGYDCSNDFEVEPVNYALMAISSSSSSSSSDNEVQKCSKQCLESFKTLQKNYDSEIEKHSRERLEIQGYELALESLESRILVHEKNELAWELEKVVKERYELKLKIEKWEESSKNLDELLNSQMSVKDKTGLGYGTQLNEMSNNSETDSEISLSVFYVRSSDEESTPANDRSSKADGYHDVPPPITGNFLTPSEANQLWDNAKRRKSLKFSNNKLIITLLRKILSIRLSQQEHIGLPCGSKMRIKESSQSSMLGQLVFARPIPKTLKQEVEIFGVCKIWTTAGTRAVVNTGKGKMDFNDLKKSGGLGNPEILLQDHAVVDSGLLLAILDWQTKAYHCCFQTRRFQWEACVAFGSDQQRR
ncbi:hypothetical protein Tco_1091090 [Tanacetum coccineum]|uniref:Uncharacterized protein n=1 Tax=Tanacetum coccineum TaxID=301880 RepID=A0ABQ5I8E1_9ASTR